MERETGFEPATSTLARSHSTTELLPLDRIRHYKVASFRGSNHRNSARLVGFQERRYRKMDRPQARHERVDFAGWLKAYIERLNQLSEQKQPPAPSNDRQRSGR
jgi:hypothetical protein